MRSKRLEELPVYLLLRAITLATLLRPRGAERVKYEGIPYSQRAGIHNDLVSIENLCVERHTPRLVVKGTAAVLTRGLGTVTVAVKPRGWSLVRHKVNLEMTKAATQHPSSDLTVNALLTIFIDGYNLMRRQFAFHLQAFVLTFGNPSAPHRRGESSIGA